MMFHNVHKSLVWVLFLPLLLTGCEQGDSTTAAASADRITLEANQHAKQFGDYTVHINAITTDQLPAEVAQGYRISRSKNRAMLNVSVRKTAPGGEVPVPVDINVLVKNLTNQLKDIDIREIRESDPLAIYYIGEVPVNHDETLVFDVDVTPEGAGQTFLLSYRQRFFTQ